jgi:hypothetical protein
MTQLRSLDEEIAAAKTELLGNESQPFDAIGDLVPQPVGPSVGSIDEVVEEYREWLYLPDARVVDVTLATYIAHHRPGEPLWVAIVGASGGGKTEPLRAVAGMPDAYLLSKLTPQTFLSGLKGNPRASLLRRLEEDKQSFVVMKDFTSILSMNRDAQRELLADMREIYDGEFSKDFGSGASERWEGRLGLLVGVTQVMDSARKVNEIMGERFVYYRLPEADRRQLVIKALNGRGREAEMRQALADVVVGFLHGLDLARDVTLSDESTEHLWALADLTTMGRSHVDRDGRTHEVLTVPMAEAPTRFVKQLGALAEALILLGRSESEAMSIAEKISLDSLPPPRLACLRHLVEQAAAAKTSDVTNAVNLPVSTCRMVLEDLTALRLVDREGSGQDLRWKPAERTHELWAAAGIGKEPDA